jgi:DHA2 family methylenomycin A resistance protein-like MFS transporter
LRAYDWTGVLLLCAAMTLLLFYTSSRPITGVEGLRDWRLLILCLLCFGALILWEQRRSRPYINLATFRRRVFTASSISAGLRMFLMSSISFVLPLYLTDIHHLSASIIGLAVAMQAGMLFVISRAGGQLADRWGSRPPVLVSMVGLILIMAGLALAPANLPIWILFALSATHGLLIGLSLAPLHRAAMHGVPDQETGAAAGLYSMIRFAGQILGVAVAGVVLQQGLAQAAAPIAAYQMAFWLYVGVAAVATLISWGVGEG